MGEYAPYEPRTLSDPRLPRADGECVRMAEPHDAGGIAALIAARHDIPIERALDGVRREFGGIAAGHRRHLMVADLDGGVVGFGRTRHLESAQTVPEGWYLAGLIVHRAYRRRGIGAALTQARLDWIRGRSGEAWYFANRKNRATIDLHARHGFVEFAAEFGYEQADLAPEDGVLYRASLA